MTRSTLAALALALAVPTAAAGGSTGLSPRLLPLAPELATSSPTGVLPPPGRGAMTLAELGAAKPDNRQRRRWNHALALLADGRPDEARGVLSVLAANEPDLRLVPAWRIAAARAATELNLYSEALALLDDPQLSGAGEACAWRLRVLSAVGGAKAALAHLPCAKATLAGRSATQRAPFVWAAARSALAVGRPDAALHYLRFAQPGAPFAKLLRAEALIRARRAATAERLLASLVHVPDGSTAAMVEALRIEADMQLGKVSPAAALKRVETHLLRWRGDAIERRMAVLRWDVALAAGKPRSALAAAATLLRYHPAELRLPAMLGTVTGSFRRWLAPGSKVPLPLAAGLMWDYRDLLPNGQGGDSLVRLLAGRLAGEGLHARAADLLEHQLLFRARDLAQGPLSVDIAQLRLLAGQPDKAQAVIRASANMLYPEPFASSRTRLEAIALFQLGRSTGAIALLADLPGTSNLREELLWRARNWEGLARSPVTARAGKHDPVTQVRLLRQAIALAMIGKEDDLAILRERFSRGFAGLPTASAFAALAGAGGPVDGATLASALAALPSVSPAGVDADLIDLSDAAFKERQALPSSRD